MCVCVCVWGGGGGGWVMVITNAKIGLHIRSTVPLLL